MSAKQIVLALVFFLTQAALANVCFGWEAKVVEVHEGDTISVLHQGTESRIHLFGIISPVKGQPFWEDAKNVTRWLMLDKEVEVISISKGSAGVDALVRVKGYHDFANSKLIGFGVAWVDDIYCNPKMSICSEMKRLQELAKLNGIGLWSGLNPVSPREWTRQQLKGQMR